MKNDKRLVDLVISQNISDKTNTPFEHYDPVLILDDNKNIVFCGLKQPGLNSTIITHDKILNIQSLRSSFGLDDEDSQYTISIPGYSYYRNNYINSESGDLIMDEIDSIIENGHGISINELIDKLPQPTVSLNENLKIPYSIAEKISRVGFEQRGNAESAMLEFQKEIGMGVFSVALEHIGDLIHRCTHMLPYGNPCEYEMTEKVDKMIRTLTSIYPFTKETQEQLISNYEFKVEHYDYEKSYDEYKKHANQILERYAKHHLELPSYNNLHLSCKRAAVALAYGHTDIVIMSLNQIKKALNSNYSNRAISHTLDSKGEIMDITKNDKYLSAILGVRNKSQSALEL